MSGATVRQTGDTETHTMNQSMGYIFCDGACSGNGTARAVAGWAWAYWSGNVSGTPARQGSGRPVGAATNQRAELTALLEALRSWSALNGGPVTILTDSMYTINCTSKWGPAWARKGWRRDSGEPLQNLDLIKPLVALWRPAWQLVHVRGHQTGSGWQAYGNNWVDRAAVAAAAGSSAITSHAVMPAALLSVPPPPPAYDPDEFIEAAAAIVVAVAPVDTIEHVPTEPAKKLAAKARRVPGLSKPVFQTDIATWFSG